MKIVEVEAFPIQARPSDSRAYWGSRAWGDERPAGQAELSTEYPVPLRRRFVYSSTIDTVVVRIETDDGKVGWGEAKAPVAPQVTAGIVDLLLKDILIGADPRDVLVLWERMYAGMRVRGHRAGFYLEAIAGVDIALWDLAGQAASAPISTLLGGKMRESIRVYASGIPALPLEAPDAAIDDLGEEACALQAAIAQMVEHGGAVDGAELSLQRVGVHARVARNLVERQAVGLARAQECMQFAQALVFARTQRGRCRRRRCSGVLVERA